MSHGPNTDGERAAVLEYIRDHTHVVVNLSGVENDTKSSERPLVTEAGNQLTFLCMNCGDSRTIDSIQAVWNKSQEVNDAHDRS